MSDPNKILSHKGKQSSIITASMSICVSPDTLDELYELINAYDTFKSYKSIENFNRLELKLLRVLFDASKMKNEETLRQKEQSISPKKGTIEDVINSFFPTGERLDP
jgi:hypothetical protein